MAEIGVDYYRKVENVVRLYAPQIRNDLRSSVSSSGLQKKSGKLVSSFQEKVRKDGIEVWGVQFRGPVYMFMHHYGMPSQTVQRGGRSYDHPGYAGRQFLTGPIDRGSKLLTDRIARISRDMALDEIDSAFEI